MLKVVLTSFCFYYISRTRTRYHFAPSSTRLLYLYFIWNPKISLPLWPSAYRVGPNQTLITDDVFSVPDIVFFLITIFMNFFPS